MTESTPQHETSEVIVELHVPTVAVDATVDLLWVGETTGIEERPYREASADVLLRAGFADRARAEKALATLPTEVTVLGWSQPDPSDLDGWAEWVEPFAIDQRLLVLPSGRAAPAGDFGITVKIDAGRSFGHGAHPTTALALRSVLDLAPVVASMLDVGTGSGILAIVGLLAGCPEATAIDIEADAIDAFRVNAEANGVTEQINVHHGELHTLNYVGAPESTGSPPGQFPLVVANLGAPVLESLASVLLQRVLPGGTLVLGGLLSERWTTLAPGFLASDTTPMVEIATPVLDGWIGPVLQRR